MTTSWLLTLLNLQRFIMKTQQFLEFFCKLIIESLCTLQEVLFWLTQQYKLLDLTWYYKKKKTEKYNSSLAAWISPWTNNFVARFTTMQNVNNKNKNKWWWNLNPCTTWSAGSTWPKVELIIYWIRHHQLFVILYQLGARTLVQMKSLGD